MSSQGSFSVGMVSLTAIFAGQQNSSGEQKWHANANKPKTKNRTKILCSEYAQIQCTCPVESRFSEALGLLKIIFSKIKLHRCSINLVVVAAVHDKKYALNRKLDSSNFDAIRHFLQSQYRAIFGW